MDERYLAHSIHGTHTVTNSLHFHQARVMPGQPQAMLDWGALHRRPLRREAGKYCSAERDLTCRKLRLTIVSLRKVAVRTSLRC